MLLIVHFSLKSYLENVWYFDLHLFVYVQFSVL